MVLAEDGLAAAEAVQGVQEGEKGGEEGVNGIWIMSQNKEVLCMATDIQYTESWENTAGHFIFNNGSNNFTKLGFFATKERALQVLDEIQGRISQRDWIEFKKALSNCEYEDYCSAVYEMPQE